MATSCDCLTKVDEQLAEKNGRLAVGFTHSGGTLSVYPVMSIERREPKGKRPPKYMFPRFCPFCGVAYPEKQSEAAS
jgi:hypothetical protein